MPYSTDARLNNKLDEWLQHGANRPMLVTPQEVSALKSDFFTRDQLCIATLRPVANFVEGFRHNLIGKIYLEGNHLLFKHCNGYSSSNSPSKNAEYLHRAQIRQLLAIS